MDADEQQLWSKAVLTRTGHSVGRRTGQRAPGLLLS